MTTPDATSSSVERVKPSTFMEDLLSETKAIYTSPANRKLGKDLILEAIKAEPVIGGVVSATEKFIQGIAGIEREVRLERLEAYLLGLSRDYDDDAELRDEDLLPVIKKLATDDENSKTEYYIRLTRKLARLDPSQMEADLRLHFIRTVSTLTRYQIDFARELKIRKTVPVCGTASFEEAEVNHTAQNSGLAMKAVRALQSEGLLKETPRPPRAGPPADPLYDLTPDFDILMQLLFYPGDFEPEKVGLTSKELSDILIVRPYLFIDNLYATYLPEALRRKGLKVKIVDKDDLHLKTDWAPLYLHTVLLNENNKGFVKLHLTQEGTNPTQRQAENYLNCKFEERIYCQVKSRNSRDAEHFRKEMDRVVSCVIIQLEEINRRQNM